jgi:hypothetical protein
VFSGSIERDKTEGGESQAGCREDLTELLILNQLRVADCDGLVRLAVNEGALLAIQTEELRVIGLAPLTLVPLVVLSLDDLMFTMCELALGEVVAVSQELPVLAHLGLHLLLLDLNLLPLASRLNPHEDWNHLHTLLSHMRATIHVPLLELLLEFALVGLRHQRRLLQLLLLLLGTLVDVEVDRCHPRDGLLAWPRVLGVRGPRACTRCFSATPCHLRLQHLVKTLLHSHWCSLPMSTLHCYA